MNRIDLDQCATTTLDPRVGEALAAAWRAGYGNAASLHAGGGRARRAMEAAREEVGEALGARMAGLKPDRAIFTSGGTEANNLALFGLAGSSPGRIIVSAIEHPSTLAAAEELKRRGWEVDLLRVSPDGVADLDHLQSLLQQPARLVSLMLGNHETGVLQPVAAAARLCRSSGVPLHVDAVQAVGKIPVHFAELDCAALSLAAHKFHGPRGVGALLVRADVTLAPQLFGGFQQGGARPGTESVELAIGLAAALRFALLDLSERTARMAALRDRLVARLRRDWPEIVLHGESAARLPHIANLAFPGLDRQALFMALDLAEVSCSTGSACQSGSSEPSPVLRAMEVAAPLLTGSLRLSLGAWTSAEEIDEAAGRILFSCKRLQQDNSARISAAGARERAAKPL